MRPSELNALMELLAPFYAITQSGQYPLKIASELNAAAIGAAIASAVGRSPDNTRVVFYSASDGVHRDRLVKRLGYHFGDRLEDSPWASLFYYLDFVLTGYTEAAEKLKVLVEIQKDCEIQGSMKGKPDTWIVVSR